jgi:NhaP-type Na+/H+ or K+/H+ antiporter
MTFGVVLFTLLVQGVTMGKLVRVLGLSERREMEDEYERRHACSAAARASPRLFGTHVPRA